MMSSTIGELSLIEKIHSIAKDRYYDSLELLHPCERPGERKDTDWFRVMTYAEMLISMNKEN